MKISKHLWRLFILWFVLGMCYVTVELIWRGVTYLPMIFVGGLCGMLVGLLNQRPEFYDRHMWQECLIGTALTLMVEYVSGYILNIRLGLDIWDYSQLPFNINGQICLPFAVLWFLLMPFAIYLDDWLRWKLLSEQYPKSGIFKNYIDLLTGK